MRYLFFFYSNINDISKGRKKNKKVFLNRNVVFLSFENGEFLRDYRNEFLL